MAAVAKPIARWIDDKADADLVRDTQRAYSQITSSADRKAGSTGVLMRIAKTYLKWDDQPRDSKRARNALKQLTGVPLSQENCTEFFNSSLRLAIIECLNESAQADMLAEAQEVDGADTDDNTYMSRTKKGASDFQTNERVRMAFRAACRTDANEDDVKRVLKAARDVEKLEAGERAKPNEYR